MTARLAPLALLLACAPAAPDDLDDHPALGTCPDDQRGSDAHADCVDEFLPEGAGFGAERLPDVVLGPPVPGEGGNGSTDVVSLGCDGQITVFFAGAGVVDRPGPDLLVFENPFPVGDATFVEPARVLVSADGERWRAFPCDPTAAVPHGCAGVALVHPTDDPTDPAQAGGDAFDLADIGLAQIHYVRLIDVSRERDPDTPWCAGSSGGFDLDALAAVH
jgi:hypothetical protein